METNKKNIAKELKELKADNLLTHYIENNDLPEDYFNNLGSEVFSKLKNEFPEKKTFSIKKIFLPVAIAASLMLLLALPIINKTNSQVEWNQYSSLDFKDYIEQNIEEFTTEEIASVASFENFSIFSNTNFSQEELEEYLLDVNIEEEDLF